VDQVPTHVDQTEHRSSGWWWWARAETITRQVKNPDRESEVKFLQGVASSRFDMVRQMQNEAERQEAARKLLDSEIAQTEQKIKEREGKLALFLEGGARFIEFNEAMRSIQENMLKIEEIDKAAGAVSTEYGLTGSVLVSFLVETRTFLKATKGEAQVVQPFVSLIDATEKHFKSALKCLKVATDVKGIFMAGNMLIKELGLLDACTTALPLVTTPNEHHKRIIDDLKKHNADGAAKMLKGPTSA